MVISSLGPWALGGIMNTLGSNSHWYKNAIYFYLHFQYNGWFIFSLFGIFFIMLHHLKIVIPKKNVITLFKLLFSSCILTFFLSVLWMKPHAAFYLLGGVGAILQFIALVLLIKLLRRIQDQLKEKLTFFLYSILKFVLVLFSIKVILQLLTSTPFFAEIVLKTIDVVIGYLHLVFLGIVSLSLIAFLSYFKLLKVPRLWLRIYIIGFILSELLIFYKGLTILIPFYLIEHYYQYLILVSFLMPIGLFGIFLTNLTKLFSIQKESH